MIIKAKLIGITRIKTKENKNYEICNFEYTDERTTGKNVITAFMRDLPIKDKDIGTEFNIYKNKAYTEIII